MTKVIPRGNRLLLAQVFAGRPDFT